MAKMLFPESKCSTNGCQETAEFIVAASFSYISMTPNRFEPRCPTHAVGMFDQKYVEGLEDEIQRLHNAIAK